MNNPQVIHWLFGWSPGRTETGPEQENTWSPAPGQQRSEQQQEAEAEAEAEPGLDPGEGIPRAEPGGSNRASDSALCVVYRKIPHHGDSGTQGITMAEPCNKKPAAGNTCKLCKKFFVVIWPRAIQITAWLCGDHGQRVPPHL